jgi:hypothetical protein
VLREECVSSQFEKEEQQLRLDVRGNLYPGLQYRGFSTFTFDIMQRKVPELKKFGNANAWSKLENVDLSSSYSSSNIYRMFRAQADWTLTHTSHKDTEQSAIEASITFDGVTLTDPLIR